MIDFAQKNNGTVYTNDEINEKFLELLPGITNYAKRTFRNYSPDRRDDAVNDVIAGTFILIKKLADAGKLDEAFATPLARYAVRHFKSGRRAGVPSSSTDVMGEHCKLLGRSQVFNFGLAGDRSPASGAENQPEPIRLR